MSDLFESLRESIDGAGPPISADEAMTYASDLVERSAAAPSRRAGRHRLTVASLALLALFGIGFILSDRGSDRDEIRTASDPGTTTTIEAGPAVVDGRCEANPPPEFLPTSSLVFEQQVLQAPGTGSCGHMTLVGGDDDQVGWVSLDQMVKPDALVPVYDDTAHQIAWWAHGVGWLDLDTVADPDFDLAARRAALEAEAAKAARARGQGPEAPPVGWAAVDYEGMRLYVPTSWRVLRSACHGRADTVTLGPPPADADCPEPDPGASWIWIAPSKSVASESPGCTVGSHNWLPGCLVQKPDFSRQVQFVQGASVALVSVQHGSSSLVGDIAATWRYQDQDRPEAQGGFTGESPLTVAADFAVAVAAGRCDEAASLADPGFDPPCVTADPPVEATVAEAGLTGWSGAVPTQSARVVTDPDLRTFELVLEVRWSLAERHETWHVINATETAPGP